MLFLSGLIKDAPAIFYAKKYGINVRTWESSGYYLK